MARLTDEEFRTWCQRNRIAPETETYLQRIRSSQPVKEGAKRSLQCERTIPQRENGRFHPV